MNELEWSLHAKDVVHERRIGEQWVIRTIDHPDHSEVREDGCTHYVSSIPEFGGRVLRVVVNRNVTPSRIVTAFFDRRLGKKL